MQLKGPKVTPSAKSVWSCKVAVKSPRVRVWAFLSGDIILFLLVRQREEGKGEKEVRAKSPSVCTLCKTTCVYTKAIPKENVVVVVFHLYFNK